MKLRPSIKIGLFVAWLAFTTRLLTMHMPKGVTLGISYEDKIVHVGLFAILVYLMIEAIETFYILKYRYVILISFIITIIYAQFMEDVQGYLAYRTNDLMDTMAGALGAGIAALGVYWHDSRRDKLPKLLLHMCCIGCGVAVIEKLRAHYDIVLFFYNPNIHPKSEYKKRLEEIKRVAKEQKLQVIISSATHKNWLHKIKGHESAPERGSRCTICYEDRLTATARRAARLDFKAFTSTLSISPHKNFPVIKKIGDELAAKYDLEFIDSDFKKDGGFQRGCELSKELKLYRQDYCGCEFSLAERHQGKNGQKHNK